MKKILSILMVFLGITLYAYADNRSCPVYGNKNYTAELENGSTMQQANEDGLISVSVKVSGPIISSLKNGTLHVTVYVNAIDRTSKSIVGTGHKVIYVKDSPYSNKASGYENIYIRGLTPGVYYNISIDNATCD